MLNYILLDFELKEYQLRRFYRDKIKELQMNMEERIKKIINDLDAEKKREIELFLKQHLESFEAMKNYYSDFNKKYLNNLKKLAEKISDQLTLQNKTTVTLHTYFESFNQFDMMTDCEISC